MNDEFFGESNGDADGKAPKVRQVWGLRSINAVEQELVCAMIQEACSAQFFAAPVLFVDEQPNLSEYDEIYGEPLTLAECLTLGNLVMSGIHEKFRRPLTVARELGPNATFDLYQIACAIEGIDPILRS